MHDIRLIRDDPDAFDAMLARRGIPAQSAEILAIDSRRREAITAAEAALAFDHLATTEWTRADPVRVQSAVVGGGDHVAGELLDAPAEFLGIELTALASMSPRRSATFSRRPGSSSAPK